MKLAKNHPIVYVTRDIERALGITPDQTHNPGYYIVTNTSDFAQSQAKLYPDSIILIEPKLYGFDRPLDTHELLMVPDVEAFITTKKARVLVFKNTPRIEKVCAEKSWELLNPKAEVADTVENKITQVNWLGDLSRYLPPHKVSETKAVSWDFLVQNNLTPCILQWGHAHTGEGTLLIENSEALEAVQKKFPNRQARFTRYIEGYMLTANITVSALDVIPGPINYQITGLKPFTDERFATVGNDWSLPNTLLDEKARNDFYHIAHNIGLLMKRSGWKGLFGIDCLYDPKQTQVFLIEINARQPASTSFESQLQASLRGAEVKNEATTFENHLSALLGEICKPPVQIRNGAQIVQRVTRVSRTWSKKQVAERAHTLSKTLSVITYPNTDHNADLIRIQSTQGLLTHHNTLSDAGKSIEAALL